MVGSPHQYLVRSPGEFHQFLSVHMGMSPCFTSHNAYPEVDNAPIPNPLSVLYQCTPFDFDVDEEAKLPDALLDAQRLSAYFIECGVPVKVIFSGGKGFHVYPQWKPVKVDVSSTPKAQGLKRIIRAIQVHAVKELGLKTMDGRIIGDYRRLMRIPNTPYVSYKRTPEGERCSANGRYCFRIHHDTVQYLTLPDILSLSREPPKVVPPLEIPGLTFTDYVRDQGIDIATYEGLNGSLEGTYAPIRELPDGLMAALIPKVCTRMDLASEDPRHVSRVDAVIYLRQLGYDERTIVQFIAEMSSKYGWVDRFNLGVTEYQVHQIVNRKPAYKGSTCRRLKQEGLCIGPACPIYFHAEGDPISSNGDKPISRR